MSITNAQEHAITLQRALSSLADNLGTGELDFAALQSMNELGWSYPITDSKKSFWVVQRAKRHALDLLRTVASSKFRYKQIHLNQRFDHYNTLIKTWDREFASAMKHEPVLLGVDMEDAFGTYVRNGFIYDQHGNEITKLMTDLGIDNDGYRSRYC